MANRPNLDIDTNSEEVKKQATSAFDTTSGGATGKHVAEIVQAYLTYTDGGSAWINISLKMENDKIYKLPSKCIVSGEEKGYEKLHDYHVLSNLLILVGASGAINQMPIPIISFENGNKVEKTELFDAYTDLIGKKVGVVIKYYKKHPESLGIDGYTNRILPDRNTDLAAYNEMRKLPTTIWMPNYSKNEQAIFEAVLYFDPETGKTLKELQDDDCTEPMELINALEKLKKHKSDAVILSNEEWDKLRKKKLKNNLKKIGEDFDESRFIPSTDIVVDEDDSNYESVSYDDAY